MQFTSVHEARGESKKEKNEKMFFSFFVPFLGVCEGPLSLWEKQNPKQFCYFLFFLCLFLKKNFPSVACRCCTIQPNDDYHFGHKDLFSPIVFLFFSFITNQIVSVTKKFFCLATGKNVFIKKEGGGEGIVMETACGRRP
jgi:hypothetical protein